MECGGLPPLCGAGRSPAPNSGSMLPHSIGWHGAKRPQAAHPPWTAARASSDFLIITQAPQGIRWCATFSHRIAVPCGRRALSAT